MMIRRQTSQLSPLSAIVALVCGLFTVNAAGAAETAKAQSFSLGIRSEINRGQIVDHFSVFVRYVAAKLASASDIEGKVVVAPSPFELAKLIQERQVDFYMDSPYPTYLINDVHGVARLLLRRWKGGMSEYRSLIFTKRNGEINRLEDLRGKVIAFEDPESTSGYFLPHSFLTRKGFTFTDKNRFDPYATPKDIRYLFAYSQGQLMDWVFTGKASAGTFSDDDYAHLEKKEKSEITILAQTEPLPRHLLSVRKDFSPVLADRLQKILLSMHENEQGRRILNQIDDTTKFDLLPEGETGLRRRLAEIFDSAKKR
jgi:phosphonate transport system substrate-binding protein